MPARVERVHEFEDESVGRLVYEDLVRLTFLAGRGLTLPRLMERFLVAMAPRIPADGLWLYGPQGLVARAVADGVVEPSAPDLAWRGLAPTSDASGRIVASVLPEVVLVCSPAKGHPGRARDVVVLFARMLALAWQAEEVALAGVFVDSYRVAKDAFRKHWLEALLDRHAGNVSASARASGLSRVSLYALMRRYGVQRGDDPDAAVGSAGDREPEGL